MDERRNGNRCRVLSLTCEYPSLCDEGATGPGLMVHGFLTMILRAILFASSLAAFAVGTFLYVRYLRRLI